MKKLQVNLMLVAALLIGAVTVSFKMIDKHTVSEAWFTFDSGLNPGHPNYNDAVLNPANYTFTGSPTTPTSCSSGSKVCSVRAEPDGNNQIPQSTLDALEDQLLDPGSSTSSIVRKPND